MSVDDLKGSRSLPWLAAIGWAGVAVVWSASMMLERTRPWEGTPQRLYGLGAIALIGAGVATLILFFEARHTAKRPAVARAGLVVTALGLAASLVAWAVPLWAGVYAVGMTLLAAGGLLTLTARAMASTFAASVVAYLGLTALEVGSADVYGDYWLAGLAAVILATVGPALAMTLLARRATSAPTLVAAG